MVRRMNAGRMLMEGASVSSVAETLHLSTDTVRKYRTILAKGGLDALEKISVGGRVSSLDPTARQWIATALSGSACEQGFPTDAWTNARLREVIRNRFGVSYSRVYTWQLATNLGLGHRLSKSSK